MTSVYIGDLNDPKFSWDNGNWNGNVPRRQGPELPDDCVGKVWKSVFDKIDSGEFQGKQVDWGAVVAKVTKKQIIKFISEMYEMPYDELMKDQLIEIINYVSNLEDDKLYALVACELW